MTKAQDNIATLVIAACKALKAAGWTDEAIKQEIPGFIADAVTYLEWKAKQ